LVYTIAQFSNIDDNGQVNCSCAGFLKTTTQYSSVARLTVIGIANAGRKQESDVHWYAYSNEL